MSVPFTLNFLDPRFTPGLGYKVRYRPKGSLQDYYEHTALTGVSVTFTTNVLPDMDYEGDISNVCYLENSVSRAFKTSKFNNAIGNVVYSKCNADSEGVTSLTFKSTVMGKIPGGNAYISPKQGAGVLVITHTVPAGIISVTDSTGTFYKETITANITVFSDITLNSDAVWKIDINCV